MSCGDSKYDVCTCVENSVAYDNAGMLTQDSSKSTFINGNRTYVVYSNPADIVFEVKSKIGNFSKFMRSCDYEHSGKNFLLYVNHRNKPVGKTYRYEIYA